jgi:hypothetical protein
MGKNNGYLVIYTSHSKLTKHTTVDILLYVHFFSIHLEINFAFYLKKRKKRRKIFTNFRKIKQGYLLSRLHLSSEHNLNHVDSNGSVLHMIHQMPRFK